MYKYIRGQQINIVYTVDDRNGPETEFGPHTASPGLSMFELARPLKSGTLVGLPRLTCLHGRYEAGGVRRGRVQKPVRLPPPRSGAFGR